MNQGLSTFAKSLVLASLVSSSFAEASHRAPKMCGYMYRTHGNTSSDLEPSFDSGGRTYKLSSDYRCQGLKHDVEHFVRWGKTYACIEYWGMQQGYEGLFLKGISAVSVATLLGFRRYDCQ